MDIEAVFLSQVKFGRQKFLNRNSLENHLRKLANRIKIGLKVIRGNSLVTSHSSLRPAPPGRHLGSWNFPSCDVLPLASASEYSSNLIP
jgi:hypothetical protein